MEYHLSKSNCTLEEFIIHTNKVLEKYGYAITKERNRYIAFEWIDKYSKVDQIASKQNKKSKADPSLNDLFFDQHEYENIISILIRHDVISKNKRWIGLESKKSEVVALIKLLQQNGYIRALSKTQLGRIFSKEFKFEISDKTFRNEPNSDLCKLYNDIIPPRK